MGPAGAGRRGGSDVAARGSWAFAGRAEDDTLATCGDGTLDVAIRDTEGARSAGETPCGIGGGSAMARPASAFS